MQSWKATQVIQALPDQHKALKPGSVEMNEKVNEIVNRHDLDNRFKKGSGYVGMTGVRKTIDEALRWLTTRGLPQGGGRNRPVLVHGHNQLGNSACSLDEVVRARRPFSYVASKSSSCITQPASTMCF